jgi:signal peptidase I
MFCGFDMSVLPICIGQKKSSVKNIILNAVIIFLIIVLLLQVLFYSRYSKIYVVGNSMSPTLKGASSQYSSGGDYVYIDKTQTAERGDIVVIQTDNTVLVKRVIAFGGDTVELKEGVLYLNGQLVEEDYIRPLYNKPSVEANTFPETVVADGCVFFMGDNRNVSLDCRNKYENVKVSCILGVVTDWSLDNKSFFTAVNTFFDFTIKGNV